MKYPILVHLRKKAKLSQKDLADLLGMTQSNYSKKENGETPFTLEEANKLSELLETSIEELFRECA